LNPIPGPGIVPKVRALVTGASGFIGRHLVKVLLEAGHSVDALVRSSSNRDGLEGARPVVGDILDPSSLAKAVENAEVVFHLASLLKMPWAPAFQTVNTEGTRNLAQAVAARTSPPVLVVVSSLAAAGPSLPDDPRDEGRPPQPISIYGRVKLDAEQAALVEAPVSIVRPPMVFGEGDRSVFPIFRTTRHGLHLVPNFADHHVSLIHATDLARALLQVALHGERRPAHTTDPGLGLYYAAARAQPTYAELGRLIGRAQGKERIRILRLPGPITATVATLSEGLGRLRDRPTFLNRDKWREANAGSWICSAAKLEALGWAHSPLEERMIATARSYFSAAEA
jgi:nucleoside-diphosphate-sugar epimerase